METLDQIRTAIQQGQVEQARTLLRAALNTAPTADLYVLSAQVAVNDLQKAAFIEKALELDPFHADAANALQQMRQATVQKDGAQPAAQATVKKTGMSPVTRNSLIGLGILIVIVLVMVMNNNADQERRRRELALRPTPIPPTLAIKSYTLSIERKTNTGILLYPGDSVKVKASGKIRVSPFWKIIVGPTGANDAEEILVGSYSIAGKFRHGALLYSMSNADEWYYCGAACDFSVLPTAKGGYLEFEVNDDDQANNTGSFTVEVTVIHS